MPTRELIAASGAVAFFAVAAEAAHAAAPSYCALYAREYAIDAAQDVSAVGLRQIMEDLAYFRCLNQDEDPPFPAKSAYFSAEAGITSAGGASVAGVDAALTTGAIAAASGLVVSAPRLAATGVAPDAATNSDPVRPSPKPPSTPTAVIAAAPKTATGYHGVRPLPW